MKREPEVEESADRWDPGIGERDAGPSRQLHREREGAEACWASVLAGPAEWRERAPTRAALLLRKWASAQGMKESVGRGVGCGSCRLGLQAGLGEREKQGKESPFLFPKQIFKDVFN